jgi:pyridoxal phosphate enzyme (YggS family)
MTQFSLRLSQVQERISSACQQFGRNPEEITLLAVSKLQPVDAVREAAACGQRRFGENFLQEALEKIEATRDLDLEWHFIGHLQSNKTRQVATDFQWVHSVDREKIARRLDAQRHHHAAPLNVCIQVSVAKEPGKGGVEEADLRSLAEVITGLPRLRLRGLMTMPPPSDKFDEQRGYFRRLRQLRDELALDGFRLDTLSMGMTGDLEAAVAEGSTMLRVGTALFGPRPRTG